MYRCAIARPCISSSTSSSSSSSLGACTNKRLYSAWCPRLFVLPSRALSYVPPFSPARPRAARLTSFRDYRHVSPERTREPHLKESSSAREPRRGFSATAAPAPLTGRFPHLRATVGGGFDLSGYRRGPEGRATEILTPAPLLAVIFRAHVAARRRRHLHTSLR
jgi:hypothetical protein